MLMMVNKDIYKPSQDSFLFKDWQGNPDIFKVIWFLFL